MNLDIALIAERGWMKMRLIDADALIDFLDVGHLRPPTEICFSELMMKNIIELMPTVDAVPVIRCRECIHNNSIVGYKGESKWCSILECMVKEEDYCSRAERKEE